MSPGVELGPDASTHGRSVTGMAGTCAATGAGDVDADGGTLLVADVISSAATLHDTVTNVDAQIHQNFFFMIPPGTVGSPYRT